MKFAKIYFFINAIIFSISTIATFVMLITGAELFRLIYFFVFLFSLLQVILSFSLFQVVKESEWVENNKQELEYLINKTFENSHKKENQFVENNNTSNNEILNDFDSTVIEPEAPAPKIYNAFNTPEPGCQCNGCTYYNNDIESRCFLYTNGRPKEIVDNDVECSDKE